MNELMADYSDSVETEAPTVVIFMATYNAQNYLAEQLDSILLQTYKKWKILVSDDGSSDNTMDLLKSYQERVGKTNFIIYKGPQKGYAANFLSLVCKKENIDNSLNNYYAYSDHDDIWEPDKLARAILWLKTVPKSTPALYCSRSKLIDGKGRPIGSSPLFKKEPSFSNALVQCLGGGNTMVFNTAALNVLQKAGEHIKPVAHDWWTYLLVIGVGGTVYYDPHPTIRYRQHAVNVLGSNVGWRASLRRLSWIIEGRFKLWNDLNSEALSQVKKLLTEENKTLLQDFIAARKAGFIARILAMKRVGVYRQTFLGNIGLIFSIVFKKV